MTYAVKEIFKTIQGEGANAGRVATFCRFAGCNLACDFCDTDFVGGQPYETAAELADAILGESGDCRFVVLTGGEPLLQVDAGLIGALRRLGFYIAIETNGTVARPAYVDWVCVSPKSKDIVLRSGNELKLVYPQPDVPPEAFDGLAFDRFSLQPIDGPNRDANTAATIAYCLEHPKWNLSLQTHKFAGLR
jgi:7-carboxy-7-deazaguanine synthase (Cx14CxxC type)